MTVARRNFQVQHTAPQASWKWYGSALDSTGGNMNVVHDGTVWYTGVDIAGVTRMQPDGTMPQWQRGRGYNASDVPQPFLIKCAAMNSDGTTAWLLTGTDNGGGIYKRSIASGAWTLMTQEYRGDTEGAIGTGRIVGHRRILNLGVNGVFIAAQRDSDNKGGIIRTVNGGSTFTEFHNASGFTIGRVFSALVASKQGYADMFYACAESPEEAMTPANDNPCVGVYTSVAASPSFQRLDTSGGAPAGGFLDARNMLCIDENGKDALYVLVGDADASNGGLWRCTINSDPGTWGGSPDVTWVKLNNGVLLPAHKYRALSGRRVSGATHIIVSSATTTGSGHASLGGSVPGAGTAFVACVYRALNAHTASPTWEAVSGPSNMLDGGTVLKPTYGTAAERWVMSTSPQGLDTNKSILGSNSWIPYDMDIDEGTGTIVVAGKSGSWISENPWDASAATVAWRNFSNSTGAVLNSHVAIHPTDNLKWAVCDVDRSGYYNLDGGMGQMQGIEDSTLASDKCHASYIRQGGSAPGRWLLGSIAGKYGYSDNWVSRTADQLPLFTTVTIGGCGDIIGVAEFTYSSSDYSLALDATGKLFLKIGVDSWTQKHTFSSPSGNAATIIVNDGHKDFWIFETGTGISYFPDVTNITAGTTVLMCTAKPTSSENEYFGRMAQDATNRTTLYATFGKNAATTGVWKFTGADDLEVNASCVKTAGTGTVSRMTGGPLTTSTKCGAIAVDPDDGSIVAAVIPYSTGTADVLNYDGTEWTSIGDDLYAEIGVLPMWIAKKGNRIYTSQFASGTPFAKFE